MARAGGWSAYLRFASVCVLFGVIAGVVAVKSGERWYSFFLVGAAASFLAWLGGVFLFFVIGVIRHARSS